MKEEAERCISLMKTRYDKEMDKGLDSDMELINKLHAGMVTLKNAILVYDECMEGITDENEYNSDVPHGATHYRDDMDGIAFYRVSDMVEMYNSPLKSQTQWQLVHHPLDIDKWMRCLKPISEYKSTNIQGL